MGFQLVPTSVTLSDLEPLNWPSFYALFHTVRHLSELTASYSPIVSATKCSPQSLVFGNMWFTGDDARYLCES